jgi:ubiquinone/menaquinone biosynthesis C-methylase UbiE
MKVETASNFYNASGISEDNLPFSKRSEMLLDRIRDECESVIFHGAKTLEIGCGNGRDSFAFEKMGALPTGIDCANEVIDFAKQFAQKIGSKARFVCEDALMMPFEQNEFDVVFLVGNNIVEFSLSDIDLICRQVRKILKESGVFCVAMNDCYIHSNGKKFEMKNYNAENGLMISHYTIPGKGTFEYHSYFWTVSMAKFICSKYFDNISIKQLDEKRYWLKCRR